MHIHVDIYTIEGKEAKLRGKISIQIKIDLTKNDRLCASDSHNDTFHTSATGFLDSNLNLSY